MAKSKSQVLTLMQEMKDLLDASRTWLSGTFLTALQAASTAVAAGDDEPEDEAQREALAAVLVSALSFYADVKAACYEIHPTLGRYADSELLSSVALNLRRFSEKVAGDGEALKSRGLTKFSSWSAGGSNVGDGHFVVLNTNRDGDLLDFSHIETLTIQCVEDAVTGSAPTGGETFVIYGEAPGDFEWDVVGAGSGRGAGGEQYNPDWGVTDGDFSAALNPRTLQAGQRFPARGASQNAGNLLPNGNCEQGLAGSGSSNALQGWTRSASGGGTGTLTLEETNQLKGTQSLKANADFKIYVPLTRENTGGTGADEATPYALQLWARCNSSLTDGDAILRVIDDSTTHATITVDLAALTDDTWTGGTPVMFVMPGAPGANLRVELEVDNLAGSGAEVLIDNIMCVPLYHYDGRAFAPLEGQTSWRYGDTATGETTVSEAGALQRMINEVFGRDGGIPYLHADASAATYWSDS